MEDFNISVDSKQITGVADGVKSVGNYIAVAWNTGGRPGKANEDSWGLANSPNGCLFTVCDGMGGHVGGQEASRIAVEAIINSCNNSFGEMPVEISLRNAIVDANNAIFYTAKENPALKGMGTTACALLLKNDTAYFAHVGDSRIYLFCNENQTLYRITEDDSYVIKVLVNQEGMSEEDAERHPQKNIIMQAVGIKEKVSPTVAMGKPANGDIFLICSDGLTGVVNDKTIEGILKERTTIHIKAQKLIDTARNNGWTDNTTLELIQITQSQNTKTEKFPDYNLKKQGGSHRFRSKKANIDDTKLWSENQKKKRPFLIPIIIVALLLLFGVTYFLGSRNVTKIIEKEYNTTVLDNAIKTLSSEISDLEKKIGENSTETNKINNEKKEKKEELKNKQEEKKNILNKTKNLKWYKHIFN
jgi:protein phosphatase